MANIKSAKKRILVNETKAARNKAIRSKVKTMVKKVEAAVAAGDKAAAQAALLAATSEIDKATTKGVYHKNTASRKVSRLSKPAARRPTSGKRGRGQRDETAGPRPFGLSCRSSLLQYLRILLNLLLVQRIHYHQHKGHTEK